MSLHGLLILFVGPDDLSMKRFLLMAEEALVIPKWSIRKDKTSNYIWEYECSSNVFFFFFFFFFFQRKSSPVVLLCAETDTSEILRWHHASGHFIGSAEALPIVREVRSVRERERERERYRDRRKWRHYCRAKIGDAFTLSLAKNSHNCDEFTLSLAKNSHFSFLPSHFPSLLS